MKKFLRTSFMAAVLVLALTVGAFAAAGDNLTAFEDVSDMTTYTFSDLPSNEWCFDGIKIAYDKGILLGYEDGTFRPYQNVNWSQAIAIAARIHSAYHGNAINSNLQSGDYWYSPSLRYCQANGMVPSSCPKNVNLGNYTITRYDLAYLFSRAIDSEDMPAISTREISDWDSIPAYYRSSVKSLYESGIMTGYADYSFGGAIPASRAHIAVVISRMLVPSERVGYDSKVNADMADYEANLENDSIAVEVGNYFYCLNKYYDTTTTQRYALYRTDGNNNATELYTSKNNEYLSDISVYNGMIYFCRTVQGEANGSLIRYNPSNGSFTTIYNGAVESYCFYDGKLYALCFTQYADNAADYKFRFGSISGGSFTALLDTMSYYEAMEFQPYGWNGCIYFKLSAQNGPTNLYSYRISDGALTKVSDLNINTSFYDGHVMYFLVYDADGNYDLNLYAMSLQSPGLVHSYGELPAGCNLRYRSLYKYGDTFYCMSSFNRNLYSIDKSGDTRMALMCGGVYNSLCWTKDRMILIPTTLATSNVNEIKVYSSGNLSARTQYCDWMGVSCYYEGARFTPGDGTAVYSTTESVSTMTNVGITVPQAFSKGDDLIVRAKYINNATTDITLRMYVVRVWCNGELVAYDINKMVSMDMKQYDIQTFTFVISGDDLKDGFEITADNMDDIEIEIIPTFDVINETAS